MWQHYRRALVPMQLFIAATCLAAYFLASVDWRAVVVVLAVMQVGALPGAAWAASLRRRADARQKDLPLKGRG